MYRKKYANIIRLGGSIRHPAIWLYYCYSGIFLQCYFVLHPPLLSKNVLRGRRCGLRGLGYHILINPYVFTKSYFCFILYISTSTYVICTLYVLLTMYILHTYCTVLVLVLLLLISLTLVLYCKYLGLFT